MKFNIERLIAEAIKQDEKEKGIEVKGIVVSRILKKELSEFGVDTYFAGKIQVLESPDLPELGFELIY